ncbi:TetR/AcrR family transcriptional regulator [Litorivivens sp.]|uniref:TetR/AcrR family transcriptional regulator n=1 Tax=Litorivivens sp. TaxID=2020868 RepID=UPI003562EEC0
MSRKPLQQLSGRPARLSRDQILDQAMALIAGGGGETFSLRKLAQALDTVPGNLYTYFASKEALFDAMADRALTALDDSYDHSSDWQTEIENWMNALRAAIRSQPALLYIIGLAGSAPGAVRRIDSISRILVAQGMTLPNAVLQAQSLLWAVMGFTMFELQAADKKILSQLKKSGAHEDFPAVMQHLALDDLNPLWEATVSRTLLGLRGLL